MATVENKTNETTTAKDAARIGAYDERKNDIANLLGWLECEIAKDSDKTWGQVGNLGKVRSDLIDTLAFLSNSEPEQIKEAMEDAREAGKK